MHDPVLEEALRRLTAEAATRFSSLIAGGEEVPFDVAEDDGDSAFFYRYVPLTYKFVADHQSELRSLPSFNPACGAVNLAGVAVPFLEARGEIVPADPDERAARMLTAFIGELWDGCAEFTLDRGKLDAALSALEAETRDVHEADLLVAPVVGLKMPVAALELPGGVRLVRADTVDAPIEAMASEGMNREAWEPQFLALVEQNGGPEAVGEAIESLHMAITAMRVFKSGGVGLGAFAYAPTSEGHWRRVATGAAPVRPGGYELSETETYELTEMCGWITPRLRAGRGSRVPGAVGWSLSRFEMGRERLDPIEAMTDHLLALRAVLEGDGPVGAPLPVRAAALIAEGSERQEAQSKIEATLRLEKSLIGGARTEGAEGHELALWLEESVRGILREVALGKLGDDAGIAADESLLAAGLGEGEGSISQRGETEEWDAIPEPRNLGEAEPVGWRPFELPESFENDDADSVREDGDHDRDGITRIMEPIPSDESEIRITAMTESPRARGRSGIRHDEEVEMAGRSDWLSEVSRSERSTIEWPAAAVAPGGSGEMARERIDTPRVRHLFPVPEDADWSVRELPFERRRSA